MSKEHQRKQSALTSAELQKKQKNTNTTRHINIYIFLLLRRNVKHQLTTEDDGWRVYSQHTSYRSILRVWRTGTRSAWPGRSCRSWWCRRSVLPSRRGTLCPEARSLAQSFSSHPYHTWRPFHMDALAPRSHLQRIWAVQKYITLKSAILWPTPPYIMLYNTITYRRPINYITPTITTPTPLLQSNLNNSATWHNESINRLSLIQAAGPTEEWQTHTYMQKRNKKSNSTVFNILINKNIVLSQFLSSYSHGDSMHVVCIHKRQTSGLMTIS